MDLRENAAFGSVKLNIVGQTNHSTRDNAAVGDITAAFMIALQGFSHRDLPLHCFRGAAFTANPTPAVILTIPRDLKAFAIDLLRPFDAHCESNGNKYTIRVGDHIMDAPRTRPPQNNINWATGTAAIGSPESTTAIGNELRPYFATAGLKNFDLKNLGYKRGLGTPGNDYHISFDITNEDGSIQISKMRHLKWIKMPSGSFFELKFSSQFTTKYKLNPCCLKDLNDTLACDCAQNNGGGKARNQNATNELRRKMACQRKAQSGPN